MYSSIRYAVASRTLQMRDYWRAKLMRHTSDASLHAYIDRLFVHIHRPDCSQIPTISAQSSHFPLTGHEYEKSFSDQSDISFSSFIIPGRKMCRSCASVWDVHGQPTPLIIGYQATPELTVEASRIRPLQHYNDHSTYTMCWCVRVVVYCRHARL